MIYDRFAVPEGLLILVFLVALGVFLFGSWRGRPDLGRRGFVGVFLASLTTTLLVQIMGTELVDGRLGQLALGGVRLTVNRVMLASTVLL